MADEQDVEPESSTGREADQTVSTDSATPGVTGVTDETIVGDRPLKNFKAELERKLDAGLGSLRAEIAALSGLLQQRAQPAPIQDPPQYTERQLAELAAAGQPDAMLQLTSRQADAAATQRFRAFTAQQATVQQLQTLYRQHPDLLNPSTPLGGLAVRHKAALVATGADNSHATDLEAVKNALIDGMQVGPRPAATTPATESVRQHATTVQQTIDGATGRRQPARSQTPAVTLTDKEWEIAKRYGYKTREDAIKAKQKFERRLEGGQTRLGAVASMVREG